MRILVTGASGFIGSELARRLKEMGHEVAGMYRYVADGRYDYYQHVALERIICDVRDAQLVDSAFAKFRPEVVYHLAAITPVSYSFIAPLEVTQVNYLGTMNIVHACKKYGVAHLVHASTSEFYGKQEVFPIKEDARPYPLSPYAVSKLAAEEYIRFYARCEGLPYTIIRPYNTYNRSRVRKPYFVVERAIVGALVDKHIRLYTPHPVRDLLDRDSHVLAYLKCLGNRRAIGEAINIGLGQGHTIGQMAEMVAEIVKEQKGFDVKISWSMEPDRPYDIETLICSNEKAKELLGWAPLYSLREGLELAVKEWAEVLGL